MIKKVGTFEMLNHIQHLAIDKMILRYATKALFYSVSNSSKLKQDCNTLA